MTAAEAGRRFSRRLGSSSAVADLFGWDNTHIPGAPNLVFCQPKSTTLAVALILRTIFRIRAGHASPLVGESHSRGFLRSDSRSLPHTRYVRA